MPRVQALMLYLSAESLWILVEVFLCHCSACLQNPIYCSCVSVTSGDGFFTDSLKPISDALLSQSSLFFFQRAAHLKVTQVFLFSGISAAFFHSLSYCFNLVESSCYSYVGRLLRSWGQQLSLKFQMWCGLPWFWLLLSKHCLVCMLDWLIFLVCSVRICWSTAIRILFFFVKIYFE